MKLIALTISFVISLVLILPGILSLGIRYLPNSDQPPFNGTEKIHGKQVIKQTFTSQENNLAGVGTSFKNPNLANKEDLQFNLEGDGVTRSLIINGGSIADGGFIKFLFDEIPNSQNKKYFFTLSSSNSTEDNALEAIYSIEKAPNTGILEISGKEATGSSLSFVTFHKVDNKLDLIGKVYSNWLGNLFKDLGFALFYIVILILLTSYLMYQTKNKSLTQS